MVSNNTSTLFDFTGQSEVPFMVRSTYCTDQEVESTKLELAMRLTSDSTLPEESLRLVFQGAIGELEKRANINFDSYLKERIWTKVSSKPIEFLKKNLHCEVATKILDKFTGHAIDMMLFEHKFLGFIDHEILESYSEKRELVIDAIVNDAKSIAKPLVSDIVAALLEENALGDHTEENKKIFSLGKTEEPNDDRFVEKTLGWSSTTKKVVAVGILIMLVIAAALARRPV